jgi:hypothetical protein
MDCPGKAGRRIDGPDFRWFFFWKIMITTRSEIMDCSDHGLNRILPRIRIDRSAKIDFMVGFDLFIFFLKHYSTEKRILNSEVWDITSLPYCISPFYWIFIYLFVFLCYAILRERLTNDKKKANNTTSFICFSTSTLKPSKSKTIS